MRDYTRGSGVVGMEVPRVKKETAAARWAFHLQRLSKPGRVLEPRAMMVNTAIVHVMIHVARSEGI